MKRVQKFFLLLLALIITVVACTFTNSNYCNTTAQNNTYKNIKGLKNAKPGETRTINLRDLAKVKFKITKSGRLSVEKYYGLLEPDKHDSGFFMGTLRYGYDIERVKTKAFYKSKDISSINIFNNKPKQKSYIEASAFEKSSLKFLGLQGKVILKPNSFKSIKNTLCVYLYGFDNCSDFSSFPVLEKNCFKNTEIDMEITLDNDKHEIKLTESQITKMLLSYISRTGCKIGSEVKVYCNSYRDTLYYEYTKKGWKLVDTNMEQVESNM